MSDQRFTVLIVDDDEEVTSLLRDHFRKRNCETIVTQDPLLVVDILRKFSVRLMLLDLKMQKLDGFGVLDKIKREGIALPPTIIITGFLPQFEGRLEAHGIGKTDVVTKPFNFDVMEERIDRKLGHEIVYPEVGSEYEDRIYRKNRCRVGFVEDEKEMLDCFSNFFRDRNYKVRCFDNGRAAFEALKTDPVDILFVDIKLPGISGDKLILELSRSANPPYMIPISGHELPDETAKALMDTGCDTFIPKPFDIVQIIEKVKTVAVKKGLLG